MYCRKQIVPKDNASKLKALTAQIMKSNIEKNRLLLENKSLREDLVRCMESKQDKSAVRARSKLIFLSSMSCVNVIHLILV